ncbi:MAG: translation elongation factor Ts [Candidatus Eisenbacteria bacterium]|uniref:Elongation factor Ts n=1 Tax=Eiseniibacteriota bacterium TaxID=2212470 RepID=A0A948WC28_UNCEI|nr:translation elongation factor Ts [Candidatus Eisenbacteria bacterium]MBU2690533.1 translation elongation factor Ts [Candidatus Eisenbacteria bacterium]
MTITAEQVRMLREMTGAGMMECKKALQKVDGDIEKAKEELRVQGLVLADKKTGRSTNQGLVYAYIHPGDQVGVLVEINCETDFVARTDDFKNFCKEIAMHIAAAHPIAISREDIPPEIVAKEREIYREQAKESGKPEKIWDKMIDGRMEKYYREACLLEQGHIRNPEITINDLLKALIAKLGENTVIHQFAHFRVGE